MKKIVLLQYKITSVGNFVWIQAIKPINWKLEHTYENRVQTLLLIWLVSVTSYMMLNKWPDFFCFYYEIKFHVTHDDLELAMYPWMDLNFLSSCLCFPSDYRCALPSCIYVVPGWYPSLKQFSKCSTNWGCTQPRFLLVLIWGKMWFFFGNLQRKFPYRNTFVSKDNQIFNSNDLKKLLIPHLHWSCLSSFIIISINQVTWAKHDYIGSCGCSLAAW